MSTLLEDVIKFAEYSRAVMLAKIAAMKNAEKSARMEGIAENGEIIGKSEGRVHAVNSVGTNQPASNQKLYLDSTNTIDLGTKTPKKIQQAEVRQSLLVKQLPRTPGASLMVARIGPSGTSAVTPTSPTPVISLADYFHLTVAGPKSTLDTAFNPVGVSTQITTGPGTDTQSAIMPNVDYYGIGDQRQFFQVYSLFVLAENTGIGYYADDAEVSATASFDGQTISVQPATGDTEQDVLTQKGKFTGTSTPVVSATSYANEYIFAVNLPPVVEYYLLPGGDAYANSHVRRVYLPNTNYLYKTFGSDGSEIIRSVTLQNYLSETIIYQEMVHNFTNREGSNVFVYSIFTVGTVQETETTSNNTINMYPRRFWILHTRLNLSTGAVETRLSESPHPSYVNSITGQFRTYEDIYADYMFKVSATSGGQAFGNSSATFAMFYPADIWQNSFPGDWIYQFRNIPYNSTVAVNLTNDEIYNFLQCSYKNNKWYIGFDTVADSSWESSTFSSLSFWTYSPVLGDDFYGGQPRNNDYTDIEGLHSFIQIVGSATNYVNYFDGSVPNTPDDINNWVSSYGGHDRKLPHASPSDYINSKPFYSYVPSSS